MLARCRRIRGRLGASVFQHQSAPDVSALPTGAYLLRRNRASIEGYLVFDAMDVQVYRFKNHLSIASARWTMLDAAGTEVATMVQPPMHLHPTFRVARAGHPDVVVRKASFARVHETWRLEGGEDGDIDVQGDILDHEFTFVAARADGGDRLPTLGHTHSSLHGAGVGAGPGAGHRRVRRHRRGGAGPPAAALTVAVSGLPSRPAGMV